MQTIASPCLALVMLVAPSAALAGTYTLPLTFVEQDEYSSAEFDFGTGFSHIESATLEFIMPDGFEGSEGTTRNSSFWRFWHAAVGPLTSEPYAIWEGNFRVPPGIPTTANLRLNGGFFGTICVDGKTCVAESPDPVWPDGLLAGHGSVEFFDVRRTVFHPIGSDIRSASNMYLPPGEIVSASMTIVGTPVPEPSSLMLLVTGGIGILRALRQR